MKKITCENYRYIYKVAFHFGYQFQIISIIFLTAKGGGGGKKGRELIKKKGKFFFFKRDYKRI